MPCAGPGYARYLSIGHAMAEYSKKLDAMNLSASKYSKLWHRKRRMLG